MKKIVLLLFMVLVTVPGFSQIIEYLDASGTPRLTSELSPFPTKLVGATITIGSATLTFSPVFADAGGSGTLALTDTSRKVVVNLGSDTIGLITTILGFKAQSATGTINLLASLASSSSLLSPGILGTFTLSIPASVAVALPTAPVGATNCLINPTQLTNWGGTTVASGASGYQYFFPELPGQGFFGFSNFTGFRLIGQSTAATVTNGIWY